MLYGTLTVTGRTYAELIENLRQVALSDATYNDNCCGLDERMNEYAWDSWQQTPDKEDDYGPNHVNAAAVLAVDPFAPSPNWDEIREEIKDYADYLMEGSPSEPVLTSCVDMVSLQEV